MNELERYVNILFVDYDMFPAARRLKNQMLNNLLTKKEALQVTGMSEKQAIQEVLSSLDDFGEPAQGNLLIYINRFYYRALQAALFVLLAGFVMSVPLLTLGKPIISLLFFLAVAVTAFLHLTRFHPDREQVSFVDSRMVKRRVIRLWMIMLGVSALWLLLAALLSFGSSSFALPIAEEGIYGTALLLARFYPALLLQFVPWAFATQVKIMYECEVGKNEE